MTDDAALLRRYAADRAEEAFAEFVRRNLPLVFSAAVRRLGGDTHRAEDVAQLVFCAAARDADRLSRHAAVTGWLYTATRNTARDLLRTETRRHAREQEARLMDEITSENEAPADWSRLRPVIDTVMDELSDPDRAAVLLRFFQGRPFAEIGKAFGLSEDAARKRVERAIDKLATLLRRRGVASTSAALALLLSSESVIAAPPTLASSITGAAVAGASAATGTVVFFGVTKLHAAVAALAIAGGAAGLVTQRHTIAALRDDLSAQQTRIARLTETNASFAKTQTQSTAELAALRTQVTHLQSQTSSPAPLVQGDPPITPPAPVPTALQLADMQRRYGALFQQLGFTTAQESKFIELKLRQFEINHDVQEAVRQNELNGRSLGVEQLRKKVSASVGKEWRDLLGEEGMAAYRRYEPTSAMRLAYLEPMNRAFLKAAVPLSTAQAEQMVDALIANDRQIHVKPTDIGTVARMDWDGLITQAQSILTPQQSTALRNHVDQLKKHKSHVLASPSP